MPLLQRMASQACRQFQEGEDLAQEMVASLISNKSKLAGYSGRGSLAGWLRVALAHATIDRFRRKRREVSLEELEEQQQEIPAPEHSCDSRGDPIDAAWGPVLAKVLREQICGLPPQDRLILNLYYVHGVSLKLIGRHLVVHEATASRRLDSLRQTVRKGVERELRARHRLRPGEIRELWQWVAEHGQLWFKELLESGREVQDPSKPAAQIRSMEHRTE